MSIESVHRLEGILRRQRERLDQVSGNFGGDPSSHGKAGSGYNQETSEGSPLKRSEGVVSTSTNNLEKAYEDLEREIREIKNKLQGSYSRGDSMQQ